PWADGHDLRRDAGERTLDGDETERLEPPEIAVEDVPVKRVHAHRHARQPSRQAAQGTRFRRVRVHDVGTRRAAQPPQLPERHDVRGCGEVPLVAGCWCWADTTRKARSSSIRSMPRGAARARTAASVSGESLRVPSRIFVTPYRSTAQSKLSYPPITGRPWIR